MSSTPGNMLPPTDGEQPPATNPVPTPTPEFQDWRSMRRADRYARRTERHAAREIRRSQYGSLGWGSWIGGAILILLGLIFLLQTMGIVSLQNWWALFLLIPAAACFVGAWGIYTAMGSFTWPARSSAIVGLIFTGLAISLLLGIGGTVILPLVLIGIGVSILLATLGPR